MKGGALRQTGLILWQELADSLRSRRAAVVLLLYLAAAALSMNGALSALQGMENELAEVLQLPPSPEPGSVTLALWKSERFRKMVGSMSGSSALVAEWIYTSPIVLIYSGLIFLFTPILAILTVSPRIAEDVSGGTARFALSRTSRGTWSLGKALGLTALLAVALVMSCVGAWIVARFRMPGAGGAALAVGMFGESVRGLIYSLPFLGLALGVSHTIRSPSRATGAALVLYSLLGLLSWFAVRHEGPGWGQIWWVVRQLTPQAHRTDLWYRSFSHAFPAAITLAALGAAYATAGFAVFRRKDL